MQMFSSGSLKGKSLEEVDSLRKMIEAVNAAKKTKLEEDDGLKEMYPKTYMFSKVTEILQKKQGLSDFEIFGGVSEIFGSQTIQDKMNSKKRFDEPRIFNANEL